MNESTLSLERLDQHVRALAAAGSAPETFRVLLQAMPMVAPRAAIFLVRQGRLKGWNACGYDPAASAAQRAFDAEATAERQAAWAAGELRVAPPAPGESPDFGQDRATERATIALRIQGRPVALLVAERHGQAQPWAPPLLSILQTIAELQLDVALIRKRDRARGAAEPAPATAAAPPPAAPPAPVAGGDDAQLDAARRFARLVATDIRLYNEEAVMQGRKNGDLVQRLNEHIHRGKETFLQRHSGLGSQGIEILHDAYVQVLAGGDGELLPSSALES